MIDFVDTAPAPRKGLLVYPHPREVLIFEFETEALMRQTWKLAFRFLQQAPYSKTAMHAAAEALARDAQPCNRHCSRTWKKIIRHMITDGVEAGQAANFINTTYPPGDQEEEDLILSPPKALKRVKNRTGAPWVKAVCVRLRIVADAKEIETTRTDTHPRQTMLKLVPTRS
jgi:hypothetical protein